MILEILRYTVFGAFVGSLTIAVGSWAVRTRRLSPFGRSARIIRRVSDPLLRPIESMLLRRGGNPQHAEGWLLGGVVVGGILVLSVAGWLADQLVFMSRTARRGPFATIRMVIFYVGETLTLAILVRVIGSWIGLTRYTPFMRPVYLVTDWIIEPLRRIIQPIGRIDVTPIVAFFLVQILTLLLTGL